MCRVVRTGFQEYTCIFPLYRLSSELQEKLKEAEGTLEETKKDPEVQAAQAAEEAKEESVRRGEEKVFVAPTDDEEDGTSIGLPVVQIAFA